MFKIKQLQRTRYSWDLNKKIDIEKSVPFVRCMFYFSSEFFFQLSINGFDFCHIAVKSPVNNELHYIINVVLLCDFFNLRLNYLRDFAIELFTEGFNVLSGAYICEVILPPFIKRLRCTLPYAFRSRADVPLKIQLKAVHCAIQNPFFSHFALRFLGIFLCI